MFASMRNKKKCKDSPGGTGLVNAKIDQQQQQSRRRDTPEALKLPSPLKYYPGTQMPMDGWFHACRLCRCWTAFSATATTGEMVPLCRRCLPSAARKGVQQAPKTATQPIQHAAQQTHCNTGLSSATATTTPTKQVPSKAPAPAAASHRCASKMTDTAVKATHAWSNSYSSIHQQHQQYHQQASQQQLGQQQQQQQIAQQPQQQQRASQRPHPGQAKTSFSYKAGSRVFKPSSDDSTTTSYIAPAQAAAAAAAATAALAPASVPAAVPTTQPAFHQLGYSRRSSNSSVPDRRSSTGDGQYAPCYKHLGPSNMQSSGAPADAYITCLGSGSSDNGTDAERQQSGSDMLGAITSLLSDLYKMGFSGSSSAGSSRPHSREGGLSCSNSGSRTAPAADTLCNLPI